MNLNSDIPYMFETKTMLMGPSGVGKSTFLQKFINNTTEVFQTKSRKNIKILNTVPNNQN
jgi:GTPase SAR1 family protein